MAKQTLRQRLFGQALSNAVGYGFGTAVAPILEPEAQVLANEAWDTLPFRPLSAQTAARAAAEGIEGEGAAKGEARKTGIGDDRYDTLRQLANEYPPPDTLIELLRRKDIKPGEFDEALHRHAVPPVWRTKLAGLTRYLVPPSDLIRMAVREVFNPAQRDELDLDAEFPDAFAAKAELLGISEADARNYWAAHWQLPSYEQGAEMLHRGELTDAQFSGLLKALDYAPTWRSKLETIARRIPPLSDMIRFAVREVYDPTKRRNLGLDAEFPDAFAAQAKLHGMSEEHAREYWAAHWRLPSATQGYHMLWRDEITPDELDGLLKALDYPTLWRDRLANIAHLVPGRVDLRRMLAHKVIDRNEVKKGYQRLGYTEKDAETLTVFAEELATTSSASRPWVDRATSRLYTVAHDEYMDRSITEAKARQVFTELGMSDLEQDDVIRLWKVEQSIARLELTPAQIKKAYKSGSYKLPFALSELAERGLTEEDATTFLQS